MEYEYITLDVSQRKATQWSTPTQPGYTSVQGPAVTQASDDAATAEIAAHAASGTAPAPEPAPAAPAGTDKLPHTGVDISMVVSGLTKEDFLVKEKAFIDDLAAVRVAPPFQTLTDPEQ
jgi:hypothetical protein